MMVDPWLVIIGSIAWIACGIATCKLSEHTAREWEKSAMEWRAMFLRAHSENLVWRGMDADRRAIQKAFSTLESTSPLDGLTATQLNDRAH